jgi:hypothetical protein
MDNFRLQQNHKEVQTAQLTKIEFLNAQIEQLDADKHALAEKYEQEAEAAK